MSKPIRYLLAILSIILLYFIIFGIIGSQLGWKNGGGIIVIMVFLAIAGFIWRKITKYKPKDDTSIEEKTTNEK